MVITAMKKSPNHPQILLIRSPFSHPADLAGRWRHLFSALQSAKQHLQVFDAAMDYVNTVLTQGPNLRHLIESAALIPLEKSHKEGYPAALQQVFSDFSHIKAGKYTMEHILSSWEETTAWNDFDPLELLDYLKSLETILELISRAYSPCRFHRHGFAHPGLNHAEDLDRFADDAEANPFRYYALNLWQPFNASDPPALALIYADSPGRMGPAVTLASAWQKRWPHIPLQLVAPAVNDKNVKEIFSVPSGQWPPDAKACIADIEKTFFQFRSPFSASKDKEMDRPDRFEEHEPQPLIAEQMPATVQAALKKKHPFIVWQWHGGEVHAAVKQLYTASRRGIWNHLILDKDSPSELKAFAAANANIIHSYGHQEDPMSTFSDPIIRFPSASPGYGRTRSMPGRPLWMALEDPALIRILLTQYELKTLMRLRVREDGRSLFEVGKNLSYQFKRPGDLPDGHLDEIVRMVEAGGSVNTRFVRYNLERAYLIAYVEEEGVIVGNSSLKHPRKEYIDAVSRQSGVDLHDFLERGYTSVRPEYRGLGVGAKLLEGLTERAGDYKIFSVIAESNIATQKMAIRNRTRRVATFYSQRAKKEMSVWIPEWMLPRGIVLPEQPDPGANDRSKKDPL